MTQPVTIKSNPAQVGDVIIDDLGGIIISDSGGSETFSNRRQILDIALSGDIRTLATDDAHTGSSTLILNDGSGDIPGTSDDVDAFLSGVLSKTGTGVSGPVNITATDRVALTITQQGDFECLSSTSVASGAGFAQLSAASLKTGNFINIPDLDALTIGNGLNIVSNSADGSNRDLVRFINQNVGASGATVLSITQNAAGNAISLNGLAEVSHALSISGGKINHSDTFAGGAGFNILHNNFLEVSVGGDSAEAFVSIRGEINHTDANNLTGFPSLIAGNFAATNSGGGTIAVAIGTNGTVEQPSGGGTITLAAGATGIITGASGDITTGACLLGSLETSGMTHDDSAIVHGQVQNTGGTITKVSAIRLANHVGSVTATKFLSLEASSDWKSGETLVVDEDGTDKHLHLFSGALAEGSIPYVNSSGLLTETNPGLFFSAADQGLAVGASTETSLTLDGVGVFAALALHTNDIESLVSARTHSNTAVVSASYVGARGRGTIASPSAVANNDSLIHIAGYGYDGTDYESAAQIEMAVDGTVSSNIVPGRLALKTTNSAGTLTTRLTISSAGLFTLGTGSAFASLTVNGETTLSGAQNIDRTAVGAGGYTVLDTDHYVAVTAITGGGDTITLLDAGSVPAGRVVHVKDANGGASTDNITVAPSAGTIEGAGSAVIQNDFGSLTIVSDGVSNWEIL